MTANVKSRAIVSTDSSTSDEGSLDKEKTLKAEPCSDETTLQPSSGIKRNVMKNDAHQNSFPVQPAINPSSSDEDLDDQQVRLQ